MIEHTFTACKYLDYSTSYVRCHKEMIGGKGKVFWMRENPGEGNPTMVQFCKKRGRLNHPEACTSDIYAQCSDYKEIRHSVPLNEII